MYFHVQITLKDRRRHPHELFVLDKDEAWLERFIVRPRAHDEATLINGKVLAWGEIEEIHIARTPQPAESLLPAIRARRGSDAIVTPLADEWYLVRDATEVTESFLVGAPGAEATGDEPQIAGAAKDPAAVTVVYGHDHEANFAMFGWLRSVGLRPREWDELVTGTGSGVPSTSEVLDYAFREAQAVVVLFTPDEQVVSRPPGPDPTWRLQARPNVLIEAGMALITHPLRTIIAVLGEPEVPSDLAGRQLVKLGSPRSLNVLAQRLKVAGCRVELSGSDWLDFPFPDRSVARPQPVLATSGAREALDVAFSDLLSAHAALVRVYSGTGIGERQVIEARKSFDDAQSAVAIMGNTAARAASERLRVAWAPRQGGLDMGTGAWHAEVERARHEFLVAIRDE